MSLSQSFTLLLTLMSCLAATARADVFVLRGGGRVEGQWSNRDESPRECYVVRTAEGATITLAASQVEQVLHPRSEEIEYERIRPTYADTAAAQWELAEWCRKNKLLKQREVHLQRVIELEPNRADARRALGYSQVEGKWVTREEVMLERGYQRYKGQWKLPQEIELLEGKRKHEAAQQEWFQKLKRWHGWLGGDREAQACQNIRGIADPMAVKALATGLRDDPSAPARLLYVEALANIDAPEAAKSLAIASLYDPIQEVRLTCLDRLQTKTRPEVISYYVGKLKDKDNVTVNRAALGLARMKEFSTVGPLIDALVTVHKFKIAKKGGDNATSSTFGTGPGGGGAPGGGGLAMGGGPTIIRQSISNQSVLDALVILTGQNFNFDKQAWKYWYAAQKKPAEGLDARRD
jgi:hypothetical protein